MTNAPTNPITLHKITVSYSAEEDRLRLTAAAGEDQTVIYWITRRMLGVVLTPLFKWLEERAGQGLGNLGEAAQRSREARLAMAHAKAQAQMHEESPVTAQPDSIEHLLTSVDVRTEPNRFLLLFPMHAEQKGLIPFEQDSLLQWLNILHRIAQQAQWDLPQWPSWFIEGQSPQAPNNKALH
ncbi:MAG TPA: hypothetical protein VLA24_09045 [Pseudomonadales bacterium]|nr:hypothetical protein [Pseudomonadales bacterium]